MKWKTDDYGAARQFLPRRPTLTERLLDRRKE